jgi:hypothetical protein
MEIENLLGIRGNKPVIGSNMHREIEDILHTGRSFTRSADNPTVHNTQEDPDNTSNNNKGKSKHVDKGKDVDKNGHRHRHHHSKSHSHKHTHHRSHKHGYHSSKRT